MKKYIVLFILISMNFACSKIKEKPMTEVSQDEFKKVFLLDVRTPEEFSAGHINNALNINLFDADFITKAQAQLPRKQTIYVYCKVGGRSAKASEELAALGYTVVNLQGGFDAYVKPKQ